MRARGRETAILSDADFDSDGDTGLDGGDEDDDETASPGRRRARRRRPPRRPPRSAGIMSIQSMLERLVSLILKSDVYLHSSAILYCFANSELRCDS